MRIHVIASIVLLVLLVLLMNLSNRQQTGQDNGIPAVQAYDYVMRVLDYTRYDNAGVASYRMQAARLTHYGDGDLNAIETPRFEIYQDERTAWTISASTGITKEDPESGSQRVDLSDDVVILGTDAQGREVEIYTDSLSVYPDSRTLDTSASVRIVGEDSVVTGTGMTADLNTSRISLLANVRGQYVNQGN